MNRSKVWATLAGVALASSALSAHAAHWHGHFHHRDVTVWRGGYWHHGPHLGRDGWWWVVGSGWYLYPDPVYPYPDFYRPPVVVERVQIESQSQSPSLLPQQQYWYFCEDTRQYYPYVSTCSSGWKPVPVTPPVAVDTPATPNTNK
ncbi:hypothetical protein KSF73_15630 [Burkholderiaceae bacterium DAT-1]|nr:hypothetical protein [Burkholderiaceae bacterium DAT-1]